MPEKLYSGSIDSYAKKLAGVMKRFGIKEADYNWNCDRFGCWVQFRYKGQLYQFDHSVAKARSRGLKMNFGSDAFAQVVLTLEDLARMVERGIYDLSTWVAGMKMLPAPTEIPECFRALGFAQIPSDVEEVRERRRALIKTLHPDAGGNAQDFQTMMAAADQAEAWFAAGGGNGR